MKTCSLCKIEKSIKYFCKNRRNKDGINTVCKKCDGQRGSSYKKENGHLKEKYGISIIQYNNMLHEQNYVCAICHKPSVSGKKLAVDHCHDTGLIRGLLCFNCNIGIGHFKNDTILLETAIDYINKDKVKK